MRDYLTPLQFAVLSLIDGPTAGIEIRTGLAVGYGVKKSGPTFYQLMARMESDGLVRGQYRRLMVGKQPIKERVYTATPKGGKLLKETREFFK